MGGGGRARAETGEVEIEVCVLWYADHSLDTSVEHDLVHASCRALGTLTYQKEKEPKHTQFLHTEYRQLLLFL